MSISSDFIFDLTTNTDSSSYKSDFFESELLTNIKNFNNYTDSSQSHKNSQTQKDSSENKNTENRIKNSPSNKKFKMTLIKKNNTSSHLFTINRIPRNECMNYSNENKNVCGSNVVNIYIDLTKKQKNDEIIVLF